MRSAQDLTFVEVVRPIHPSPRVDQLLNAARTFGKLMFSTDQAVAFVTITDREIVGDDGPALIGAQPEFCRVYNNDGLRLPLIERLTIPETKSGNSFASAARILTDGRSVKKSKQIDEYNEEKSTFPLIPQLNEIQCKAGHPNPENLRLKVAPDIGHRLLGNLRNGSIELMLLPDLSDEVTSIVFDQAKFCFDQLQRISKKVAFPTTPQVLGIPFARLSSVAESEQRGRFINEIRKVLPQYVTLDKPRIRGGISS